MKMVSPFDNPALLGFDHIERTLSGLGRSSANGYPPYDIERTGEDKLRIVVAVAGFRREDLCLTVEDNQLLVKGKQPETPEDKVFLHRGIAARQFRHRFLLADGMTVDGARTENGLLHIDLSRPPPENRVTRIEIRGAMTPETTLGPEQKAFLALGVNMVAYVRRSEIDGMPGYAIHAADGTRIGFAPTRAAAEGAIVQNDMEPLALH